MESHQKTVEQLFGAALDHSLEQRAAFLDEACLHLPELRPRVEALLLADERLGGFLEEPLLGPPARRGKTPAASGSPAVEFASSETASCCFQPLQLIADRFRVIRFIARGGMGEIYEVEDLFLQRVRVALKIILPTVATTEGAAHHFEQEVLLARKVIHPNLCPIYDIARSAGPNAPFLFLTMKLLSGETLGARLRRPGSISANEALSVLRQLVAGLGALHAAGIIHRDIKPSNVMVEGDGDTLQLCITDFGLARTYGSELTLGTGLVAGTPGYLAPELLRGERPSQASDLFALGVLLELVVAHQASSITEAPGTRRSAATTAALLDPRLSLAVRTFRSEDPELRSATFRQIQQTFELPVRSQTLAALPLVSASPRAALISRRRFAIGAATAACLAAAATAWNLDRLRDLLHPLPRKRFVALLKWPAATDPRLRLVVSDVIDVIGRELSRVEAFDRNLLVIAESASSHPETAFSLSSIRDTFGANLILAASGQMQAQQLDLSLKVLDPTENRSLRERHLHVGLDDQTSLAARAVHASAELLGVTRYELDEHLAKVSTDKPEAYAAFLAAEALRKQNTGATLQEAIHGYKEALSIDPHYSAAMAGLAKAYLRVYGTYKDPAALVLARENCETALSLNPSSVEAHHTLAWVYEREGDRPKATLELTAALALDPTNPNTLLSQARLLEESGRFPEAEDRFARVLRLRPNYWMAHNELGLLLNNLGRFPQALIEFRAASLAAPKNSIAANNVGSVLLQQGKLSEAETSLKQSFSLEANDVAAANLAAVYRLGKHLSTALTYAQRAVSLNPDEPHNLLELADVLAASNLHAQSLATCKKAIDKCAGQLGTEPSNGPLWMLLAVLHAKTGDTSSAATLIPKAEGIGADDIDSQLLKVRTLELLGDRKEALGALARCLSRGATRFQAQTLPDLDRLRGDPGFRDLVQARGTDDFSKT